MKLDFEKYADGLVPAIVQDAETQKVLMLGFMNAEAFAITQESGKVTFFSRTRGQIWTKGETSGNFLRVEEILIDCDNDTLLIKANPVGAVCHTGADTCFDEEKNFAEKQRDEGYKNYIFELEKIIQRRKAEPNADSYTSKLFAEGINKIAQKVGEEAVELIIEAKDDDDELFKNEASDLIYHFLVLLAAKDLNLKDVIEVLEKRRK